MRRALAGVATLLGVAGCITGPEEAPFDYSIDQNLECFCFLPPARLFVCADTVALALNRESGAVLPQEMWSAYRTIRGLFQEIADHDTALYRVDVTYDARIGFPSRVFVDAKPFRVDSMIVEVVDDEIAYVTTNYRRLR